MVSDSLHRHTITALTPRHRFGGALHCSAWLRQPCERLVRTGNAGGVAEVRDIVYVRG